MKNKSPVTSTITSQKLREEIVNYLDKCKYNQMEQLKSAAPFHDDNYNEAVLHGLGEARQ